MLCKKTLNVVTVHHPICLDNALFDITFFGTFLPIPSLDSFKPHPEEGLIPGEYILLKEPIILNKGSNPIILQVFNQSDRPIQVGSHYHFLETNPYLEFDRVKSYGKRLNM